MSKINRNKENQHCESSNQKQIMGKREHLQPTGTSYYMNLEKINEQYLIKHKLLVIIDYKHKSVGIERGNNSNLDESRHRNDLQQRVP